MAKVRFRCGVTFGRMFLFGASSTIHWVEDAVVGESELEGDEPASLSAKMEVCRRLTVRMTAVMWAGFWVGVELFLGAGEVLKPSWRLGVVRCGDGLRELWHNGVVDETVSLSHGTIVRTGPWT